MDESSSSAKAFITIASLAGMASVLLLLLLDDATDSSPGVAVEAIVNIDDIDDEDSLSSSSSPCITAADETSDCFDDAVDEDTDSTIAGSIHGESSDPRLSLFADVLASPVSSWHNRFSSFADQSDQSVSDAETGSRCASLLERIDKSRACSLGGSRLRFRMRVRVGIASAPGECMWCRILLVRVFWLSSQSRK